MTWMKSSLLLAATLFLSSIPAFGQIVSSGGAVMAGAQPVTGEPYAVVEETEHSQKLADGTNIVTKSQARLYRDSSGRTRRERYVGGPGIESDEVAFVTLQDPIAGTTYLLRLQQRTAQLIPVMTANDRTVNPNGVQKPVTSREGPSPKSTSENLGTQSFFGVLAEGWRSTITFPEGYFGNDKAMQTVTERWVSAELRLTMLEKRLDPRSGETITRVISLDRAEPDPTLFQIPADYTVQGANTK